MFSKLYILFAALHIVTGQINGEFWWLNDKLAAIRRVEPPPPKFDNELGTDESVKVIFKDTEESSEATSLLDEKLNKWSSFMFRDNSKLAKPVDVNSDIKVNKKISTVAQKTNDHIFKNNTNTANSTKSSEEKSEDVFEFIFPDSAENNNEITLPIPKTTASSTTPNNVKKSNKISINDKIWFEDTNVNNLEDTESICTFLKKKECIQNKGIIHAVREKNCPKHIWMEKVCCILPLPSEVSSMLKYPEPVEKAPEKYKRSVPIESSSALKQRNALLERKFITIPLIKPTASASQAKVTQKIVTPDDYADPYWNIKNLKMKNPSEASNTFQNTKYDYSCQDYDDYTVELPKPGLIGLYSDLAPSQTTWRLSNKNKGFYYDGTDDVSEEEEDDNGETSFGYSSFDPRRGSRVSTTSPKSVRRPMKITISTEETPQSIRPISFKSKPNFHVLEGFKLMNLAKDKDRFVKTTVPAGNNENNNEKLIKPCPLIKPGSDYEDLVDEEQQVYKKCGKSVKKYTGNIDIDTAEEGFDPWLALVIRTKSRQKILCYATILHPRAAVTAADCVIGSQAGEISIMTGVWKLNEGHSRAQQRLCTVHAHSQYNPDDLENNIALLHWKRPLRLDVNVQPACLADPHVGDECYFVGWGGYDQAIEKSSRRQKATILTPRKCMERISKPDVTLPRDAFCASVNERGTVTGVGGPLLCGSGERTSMVGLAVWREDVVVLLPALQWVVTTLSDIL